MRTMIPAAAALVAAAALAAPAAPLRVVATTSDLADIARAVAGDRAGVRSICTGADDPHMMQGKPSFILAARDADLWIRVGLELEIGWEPVVLEGSRNPRIQPGQPGHLDAGSLIEPIDVPAGPVTREMGDVHPSGNPHFWVDPWNARIIATAVAERLAALDAGGAGAYAANAASFRKAVDERMFGAAALAKIPGDELWALRAAGTLDERLKREGIAGGGWDAMMRPLRGARVFTYHRSWGYFARRFGLEVAGEIEPKPGIPPSGAHLDRLVAKAKSAGVALILQEPFYNARAARRIAEKTGLPVVLTPISVGGAPEAKDYLATIDTAVARLAAAKPSAEGARQ
ncbi:MAG: zinc ABC transporter substrate-binding protein [Lentisphaerae bacterium]|nr:zinc ABC transporter substrate-binding protein [Lentisphaerota bacterium]